MDSQPAEAFLLMVQLGPGAFLPGHILAVALNQKGRVEVGGNDVLGVDVSCLRLMCLKSRASRIHLTAAENCSVQVLSRSFLNLFFFFSWD